MLLQLIPKETNFIIFFSCYYCTFFVFRQLCVRRTLYIKMFMLNNFLRLFREFCIAIAP